MVYGLDPNSFAIWIEHVALSCSQKPMNRISSIHPSIQLPRDRFAKKRNATRKKKTANKKNTPKLSDVTNKLGETRAEKPTRNTGLQKSEKMGVQRIRRKWIEEKQCPYFFPWKYLGARVCWIYQSVKCETFFGGNPIFQKEIC